MTTVARPGTPFPTAESVSYFPFNASASGSSSRRSSFHMPTQYTQYSQPIHFPVPTRAVLTPPSLLKRASSSGSNSSGYHLTRTPSASPSTPVLSPSTSMGRRDSRCSSTDCASPVMPTTPIVEEEDEAVLAPPSTPFELPAPLFLEPEISNKQSTATKGFPVKQFFSTFESISKSNRSLSLPTTSSTTVSRPKLKRRDTPRPKDGAPTMSPFWDQPILSPVQENGPKRRFTSMVDGKSWVVVE